MEKVVSFPGSQEPLWGVVMSVLTHAFSQASDSSRKLPALMVCLDFAMIRKLHRWPQIQRAVLSAISNHRGHCTHFSEPKVSLSPALET